ncbi:Uncharacterised protein [Vibrio cholerae]|nr:Uncharacterised protein [Vibrio cholerae]
MPLHTLVSASVLFCCQTQGYLGLIFQSRSSSYRSCNWQ